MSLIGKGRLVCPLSVGLAILSLMYKQMAHDYAPEIVGLLTER